ncbi:MAG: AAA family ATPase [Magnetococcales bacterium]|nr:AAA family ATPase [Magnetococcales bacterium]NGZ05850.1 AAA family ATPase [Magnetococcales bacterium]
MITVVGNLKGGCGKSTITFNLAVWLARRGMDVVTFDLDPQATLSDAIEVRREEGVTPDFPVYRSESDPIRIMAKHPGEVLVDVGASNLWAMRQAIGQADRILSPVPPSQADVWSTARFLELVKETATARGKRPEILLFVNRADTHPMLKESNETEAALATLPGVTILPTRIAQRTAYRRSFSEGRAVFELAPGSKASQEFLELAGLLYPHLNDATLPPPTPKGA